MTIRTIEQKQGRKWEPVYVVGNETKALHSLAQDLAAKYIGKAQFVGRIVRRQNYDGTQTYTVYYSNGTRAVYDTDIY